MADSTQDNQNQPERIRISVRNLVEFILRSGDIDTRRSGADKDAMQQGGRIHRKIQGRMGSDYEAEVVLTHEVECGDFLLFIEGRADGILTEKKRIVVDEIKAVYRDIMTMTRPVPVHLAQAKCYAYIYAYQHNLPEITVRMTYCQMETEQIRYFYESYKMDVLEEWFLDLISGYEKWAAMQKKWIELRNHSVRNLRFPFAYREQQKNLISGVYRTIEQGKRLFLQASTGAGKTISVIYPAIQAVGRGMADKIFYLTAKTITRKVALDTFLLLMEQEFCFKVVAITAKEKVCFCEETTCNPDACVYAKGHYDRINDCVYELLQKEDFITTDVICDYARMRRVCPFELSLDVAVWVDAVVCDYNYVFDYDVCLKRFFAEGNKDEYIFLIDEAHNLVDRGRSMYSAQLCKEDFLAVKRQVRFYSRRMEKHLEACNKKLLEWKRTCEDYEVMTEQQMGNLSVLLVRLMSEMDTFLEEEEEPDIRQVVLEFYFKVRHFMNMYDLLDENYVIYKEMEEDKFIVRLFCVNPSVNLNHFLKKGRAAVFLSATLLPVSYYMQLLSGGKEDFTMYARSPFLSENRLFLVGTDVSSRFSRRTQAEYNKIADYIEQVFCVKKGNYIIFLPSYVYMQSVYETYVSRKPGADIIVQDSHMDEEAREQFLQEFGKEHPEGLAAFCVLGGIFGEGIDLKKEQLIGAIIVGTGMPQIGTERKLLQEYFDRNGGCGFDYAFRYPGFNKILQAAGRVIRTEEDKGIIVLLEERLNCAQYHGLYPVEWGMPQLCTRKNFGQKIQEFWK